MQVIQELRIRVLVPCVLSVPIVVVKRAELSFHLLVKLLLLQPGKAIGIIALPISSHLSSLLGPIMLLPLPVIIVDFVGISAFILHNGLPMVAVPTIVIMFVVPTVSIISVISVVSSAPIVIVGKNCRR
jgi:hypothetical protein